MRLPKLIPAIVLALLTANAAAAAVPGRLKVDGTNKRWMSNDSGKAIVLAGPHQWHINQDYPGGGYTTNTVYFRELEAEGATFTRGWLWEDTHFTPNLYQGSLPVNLDNVNTYLIGPNEYRLRVRARRAKRQGLYMSVMLFQGWSTQTHQFQGGPGRKDNPWAVHPFKAGNNTNLVSGDFNMDPEGAEIHSTLGSTIRSKQKKFLEAVVNALENEVNVIFEIANEIPNTNSKYRRWQNYMVDQVKRADNYKRPVLVSCRMEASMSDMTNTPAEMVAPCGGRVGFDGLTGSNPNPPHATGSKVMIADSDHIEPVQAKSPTWPWKFFLRGYHPWFMDLSENVVKWKGSGVPNWTRSQYEAIRDATGAVGRVSARTTLRQLVPQKRYGSSPVRYIGAAANVFALYSSSNTAAAHNNPVNGDEYLVLGEFPTRRFNVCGLDFNAGYDYTWLNIVTGQTRSSGSFTNAATGCRDIPGSIPSGGAVLHLKRR